MSYVVGFMFLVIFVQKALDLLILYILIIQIVNVMELSVPNHCRIPKITFSMLIYY